MRRNNPTVYQVIFSQPIEAETKRSLLGRLHIPFDFWYENCANLISLKFVHRGQLKNKPTLFSGLASNSDLYWNKWQPTLLTHICTTGFNELFTYTALANINAGKGDYILHILLDLITCPCPEPAPDTAFLKFCSTVFAWQLRSYINHILRDTLYIHLMN